MATITVVSPKTIFPGPLSFFTQLTEQDSITVAALRWVLVNTSGNWGPVASDPTSLLGTNMVAGANITSGKTATDIFVYTTGVIVEANTNSTGTDPSLFVPQDVVVSSNDHQIVVATQSTAISATNRGTAVFNMLRLSPKDASLDTNVREWAMPRPERLGVYELF